VTLRFGGRTHPVKAATVRLRGAETLTNARGQATFARRKGPLTIVARKPALTSAKVRLR
jgi:hypothetical protein